MRLTAPIPGATFMHRTRLMSLTISNHRRRALSCSTSRSTSLVRRNAVTAQSAAPQKRAPRAPNAGDRAGYSSLAGLDTRCISTQGIGSITNKGVLPTCRGLHTRHTGIGSREVGGVLVRTCGSGVSATHVIWPCVLYGSPQLARIRTDAGGKQGPSASDSKAHPTVSKFKAAGALHEEQKEEIKAKGNAEIAQRLEKVREKNKGNYGKLGETIEETEDEVEKRARGIAAVREKLRGVGQDAREDAREWIRDKREDVDEMKEVLRDARKEGRLREELSDQAKESRGKLKELWRKYGMVGIGCYIGIYFGSIGLLYVIYDYGVMTSMPAGGAAVIEKMQQWMKNTPEWSQDLSNRLFGAMANDHRARSFVLAWATSKILEPLRLVAAIAITPTVARAVGRAPARGVDDDDDDEEGGYRADSRDRGSKGSEEVNRPESDGREDRGDISQEGKGTDRR